MPEEDSLNTPFVGKEAVSDLQDDMIFAFSLYVFGAFLCFATFLTLLYITYKVIKKVGSADFIIPAMLIMLQLSAIGKSHSAWYLN